MLVFSQGSGTSRCRENRLHLQLGFSPNYLFQIELVGFRISDWVNRAIAVSGSLILLASLLLPTDCGKALFNR